jgi:hypothetical protein
VGGDCIRDTREHGLGAAGNRVDVRAGSGEDLLDVGFALLLNGGQSGEKWSLCVCVCVWGGDGSRGGEKKGGLTSGNNGGVDGREKEGCERMDRILIELKRAYLWW